LGLGFNHGTVGFTAMAIGKKTGGGSRKGVPNKVNKELKEMILGALDDVGGQDYLARQADENPAAFMSLVAKVLPKDIKQEISGANGGALVTEIRLIAMSDDSD
jgi:hypothetical protein